MGDFAKIFDRYKTYDDSHGRGSVSQWRDAFETRMGMDEARRIVRDTDPYLILGLDAEASIHDLKSKYRQLMMENHPDRGGDPALCKKIIAAFTVLEKRLKS